MKKEMEMETTPLNPWFAMWLHPRRTIRQIVDSNPERLVILLAAISSIAGTLQRSSSKSIGDHMSLQATLFIAMIIAPFIGILALFLGGILLGWTGRWIGGTADSRNIRAALAWSSVPQIWSLALWIPAILIFGNELFTKATPIIDASLILTVLYASFFIGNAIISIWQFVVLLHALGEVQGFSAWKAFLNSILAFLVILIPFILIAVGMVFLLK
jgi:hypothetical protein